MNYDERLSRIRHILIALDASVECQAALETAAELAADLGAELTGLFVEDANLLRLVDSPFAREVGTFSTMRRRLDAEQLERQFRAQASQMRRALMRIAQRQHVPCHFRVARGTVTNELAKAASETDMIVLAKAGWSPTGQRRLSGITRDFLAQAPTLTLVLQERARLRMPVLIVYDGSPAAQRALVTAARFLREDVGQLTVVIVADDPGTAEQHRQEVAEWLRTRNVAAYYRYATGQNLSRDLMQLITAAHVGVLVLPQSEAVLGDEAQAVLLDQVECPVLLVR